MPPRLLEPSNPAHGQLSAQLSKRNKRQASELRKTLKPLMEKRRRARINDSLNKLKTLILPLIGKDSPRYSKLEKADILEMTVRFLHNLPKSPVHDHLDSYREGYRACLLQLTSLLPSSKLMGTELCNSLTDYLERCMDLSLVSYYSYSHGRAPTCPEEPRCSVQSNPNERAADLAPSSPGVSPRQQATATYQDRSIWRPWLSA
ncbi:transcription factor HES-2.1 [Pristis pectinata]|uniref:transcription factor HES-2.1 n=1 Tax=Pristis pectinata TaxID=685728 RepID=UPI00223DC6FE|nr:transcription factor HES-2.1 [Pristis pectinata]